MSAKFEDIKGLTDAQVVTQREKHGANELPPPEVESFFDKLKDNFDEPLIKILLAALVITLLLAFFGHADYLEGIGIGVAVFLATFVATYSEYKNENSFRLLQEQASKVNNKVFRNGLATQIPVTEIVVGDMVLLQAGDKIPADGFLMSGELMVDQVALTGEKLSVRKGVSSDFEWKGTDLYDERECFKGTVVDDGEAVMKVTFVGEKTYFGSVYLENLKNKEEERESPLQVKLSNLADGIAKFGYIGAASITVSFLFKQFVIDNGYNLEAIMNYLSVDNIATPLHDVITSIILAVIVIVVAVPEGLPMMIAIVLSLNMRKLLSANVLVRKLLGIETAGSIDILFVDKTGTLTKGVFEPQVFVLGDGKEAKKFSELSSTFADILGFCARESTSAVAKGKDGSFVGGNASDRALLEYLDKSHIEGKTETKIEHEILFNSERKFSAVQINTGKHGLPFPNKNKQNTITIVKGAPDLLFPHVKAFYNADGEEVKFSSFELNEVLNKLSSKGTRVIAIATTPTPIKDAELVPTHSNKDIHSIATKPTIPSPLTLVGILGIKDEIRQESGPAIELAQKAGIQVVMITGDRKETAVSVATELGLISGPTDSGILSSDQLAKLSDEELEEMIPELAVIARALPTDKSRLVKICKNANRVVGMTGDGVNDSAALVAADVGFAMGSGSEVAKEASDIVILDDNFESITKAVLYGRTIFKSIRKFIVFQSTVNAASLLIVFLGPFCGFDFPLTLIQLLWVNIVMDTFAAIAFGGEPAISRYMHEKPIKRDEDIITPTMWCSIIFNGVFIAGLCIFALLYPPVRTLFIRDGKPDEQVFLTAFFCLFIFITNFNSFNARSPRKLNIFDHITYNRGFLAVSVVIWIVQITFTEMGGKFLRTVGMTANEWMLVIAVASLIFPFDAIRKIIMIRVCKSLEKQSDKQSHKTK